MGWYTEGEEVLFSRYDEGATSGNTLVHMIPRMPSSFNAKLNFPWGAVTVQVLFAV